jgi:hypothetical protein
VVAANDARHGMHARIKSGQDDWKGAAINEAARVG